MHGRLLPMEGQLEQLRVREPSKLSSIVGHRLLEELDHVQLLCPYELEQKHVQDHIMSVSLEDIDESLLDETAEGSGLH